MQTIYNTGIERRRWQHALANLEPMTTTSADAQRSFCVRSDSAAHGRRVRETALR